MKFILSLVLLVFAFRAYAIDDTQVYKIFYTRGGKSGWTASAFYIDETHLMTAAHTFQKTPIQELGKTTVLCDGTWVRAEVLAINYDADICIIKTERKNKSNLTFKEDIDQTGIEATTAGYAYQERTLKVHKSSVRKIHETKIEIRGDVEDGLSGGPVVNDKDEVIGMCVSGYGNSSYAIRSKILLEFLRKESKEKPNGDGEEAKRAHTQ